MIKYTIDYIKKNNLILFEFIGGSVAYGTNTINSDIDIRGVFIMEHDDIYGLNYVEQINDKSNDTVYYELGRFMRLLETNNPNILEFTNPPKDCINILNPLFKKYIINNKHNFLSKKCKNSFGGYALMQIKKAKSVNKKMNWETEKIKRKNPLDFCKIIKHNGTQTLKSYLKENNIKQENCGASNIDKIKGLYALYYDKSIKFKGLIKFKDDIPVSNDIILSSIPKNVPILAYFNYNTDAYVSHCKDFNEYNTWLKERNVQRYVDVNNHGQKIDGKNMLHCSRLIDMAKEIASGQGIIVRRSNAKYLLDIRTGKYNLQELLDKFKLEITKIDKLFLQSNLPNKVDHDYINNITINLRKEFYNK